MPRTGNGGYIKKLRHDHSQLKELIRIQALGMLAMVDGIDSELLDAIEKGYKISYQIKGEKNENQRSDRSIAGETQETR